jgi:hypothetical protein
MPFLVAVVFVLLAVLPHRRRSPRPRANWAPIAYAAAACGDVADIEARIAAGENKEALTRAVARRCMLHYLGSTMLRVLMEAWRRSEQTGHRSL